MTALSNSKHSLFDHRSGFRTRFVNASLLLISVFALITFSDAAQAIPSYARQTNLQCSACHNNYPQLNAFGRSFKMNGYTLQAADLAPYKRFSGMLQPSVTHTAKGQEGGAAPDFNDNNNFAVTQASVFYGGRLANGLDKLGSFVQVTYDGVEKGYSWDLADFRWANNTTIAGKSLTWGIDLNNTPTVQDMWNTTPIWGFPFSGSGLAPGPSAATLISDPLAGTVAGLGAYAHWNNIVYLEVNLYKTLGQGFLDHMGVSGVDHEIKGVAPYWRLAVEKNFGAHYLEVGTFGLYANTYPERDRSAHTSDQFHDIGFDMQYEYTRQNDVITGRASYIHEDQKLRASNSMMGSDNLSNNLNTEALSLSYLYDQTYGLNAGYNHIGGSTDATYFGGSPVSDYCTLQMDWLPMNKHAGPNAPYGTLNPIISLQYTANQKLDGVSSKASDNNTLYLQAWVTF